MPAVIHVVDDDASFRTAIGRVLRASGYEVKAYESAEQLLERLHEARDPGCILLDVKIPGFSGPDLQNRLIALGSTLPIIFLTGYGDIPTSVQAIKSGAEDFLTKPVLRDTLIESIERAIAHSSAARRRDIELNALRALVATLTPREREVFALVVRGKMNKQIAFTLGTTERTIKAHRHKVMEKLKAQSLAELVSIAARLDILAEPSPDKDEATGAVC
jgi:RNA polymerase sigma factor (sigma-70 family)